ncbi:uncharacterized protein Z519_04686 [Cladophialophora bantiana CBS 173.52]|uniref:Transcription factor domain-containing protein n=1 Tax=Cladophialophora bantiana (strain ATCC 10958 / CBS 173.52 / CDC B-1940 / NIH 8579) TaxID=1442370 RepID=A0A0D2ID86_CLAB1|nr:uncharacterized protein Z519_04686 [Cladophialophora bantiana CBS 173.52]KIW94709.1 hypothetical protein Z519_04686 [Cladophialophora bantiana CBS 173.52]
MAAGGTNVFFVPYRPHSKSKKPPSDASAISQQKHAAREYHRKAKLERLAKLNAIHNRHARSSSADPQPGASSRPLLLRNKSFPTDEDYDRTFAVFDVGTGKLDPFNACVPSGVPSYALDILDYGRSNLESGIALCLAHYPVAPEAVNASLSSAAAVSKQWRIMSSSRTMLSEGTIKTALLACAMHSPAAFWSIIFAGATHNAYLLGEADAPGRNRALRLSYKTQAIRELNREIQELQGPASDELLLAIITLASHGSGEQLNPPSQEENLSALQSVQSFQYYGRMQKETAHLKAICHLVYQKGGLHTVKMPGLANALALADTFYSFQDMRVPAFPLLAPTSLIMSTWSEPSTLQAPSLQNLTSGFQDLGNIAGFGPLMEVLHNARLITIGLDAYLSGHPSAPSLNRIICARNFMTHDLLSLPLTPPLPDLRPSAAHRHDNSSSNMTTLCSPLQSLYSLVRLSTMAYTLLVLFPVPTVAGIHGKLAQQLMLALDDCVVMDLWITHSKLLLWSTVLGGIVAKDTSLRPWFAEMIRQARTKTTNLALMDSASRGSRNRLRSCNNPSASEEDKTEGESRALWTVVRDMCCRFLWFDGPECDGLGRAIWEEACDTTRQLRTMG